MARLLESEESTGFRLTTSPDFGAEILRVSTRPTLSAQVVRLGSEPLALVVSPRLPVRWLSLDQARAVLSGRVADWSDVGSPTPVKLEIVQRSGRREVTTANPALSVASYDELVGLFPAHPGAVSLASASEVDFRVNSLIVDDFDPVRDPDPGDAYPFRRDLVLEFGDWGPTGLAERARDLAGQVETEPSPDQAFTVTMVGDIILGRTVHTIMTRLNDYAAPFRLVADELAKADLTIGNLECSLSDTIPPPDDPFTFEFMTLTAGAQGLRLSGIDGVSQANNHSMNFGAGGMRDTLAALDATGIRHFGIGETLDAACEPAIFDVHGTRVAFLGYDGITGDTNGATGDSAGTAPLVAERFSQDIVAATKRADVVIPFIHWGVEYTLTPTGEQRSLAHRAIDAGATMVVGSHPHWVQGIEEYRGRPIVYSLGNFVFDQDWSPETKQGLIMHLVFQGPRLAALRLVPVLIENFYQPRVLAGEEMMVILDRVWNSTDLLLAASS
jgi:poly-gamma-glutamate synthesis protein (capsule biosynthesis protein)